MPEAIEKSISFDIQEIVHKEKYGNLTIIMYTVAPDKEKWPNANFDGLGIGFFEGNDKEGWKNIGHNGWSNYNNENFTFDFDSLLLNDDEGKVLYDLYVAFGEVNNPIISVIETKAEGEKEFRKAKMMKKNGKRYYFQLGRVKKVRGLSNTGIVIDQQGG